MFLCNLVPSGPRAGRHANSCRVLELKSLWQGAKTNNGRRSSAAPPGKTRPPSPRALSPRRGRIVGRGTRSLRRQCSDALRVVKPARRQTWKSAVRGWRRGSADPPGRRRTPGLFAPGLPLPAPRPADDVILSSSCNQYAPVPEKRSLLSNEKWRFLKKSFLAAVFGRVVGLNKLKDNDL